MTIRGSYYNFTVGTTPAVILPADNNRRCLLLSCPSSSAVASSSSSSSPTADSQFLSVTNPVTSTDIQTYTVPANTVAYVELARWHLDSGGQPTLLYFIKHNGVRYQMTGTANPDTDFNFRLYLSAGDQFIVNCSSGQTCTMHTWQSIVEWPAGAAGAPSVATNILTWGNQTTNTVSQSYTVPAGFSAYCPMMTWCLDSGLNPTENGSVVRGGTRYDILFNISSRTLQNPAMWLSAGDTIEWFCTAGNNGSYHGVISLAAYAASGGGGGGTSNNQVYIGFGQSVGASTGIPIYGAVQPLLLSYDCLGTLIQQPVWAVAGAASTPLNVCVGYDADDLYCPA